MESEQQTRRHRIDPRLNAAGWRVVSIPFDRLADVAQAIEEFPTSAGPADYALADQGQPIGVVEAKKLSVGPEGVLTQASRYSKGMEDCGFTLPEQHHVPFLYSTNGEQVMFHDVRWGAEHHGRFLWVLLNSGSSGAYAFNHDPDTLKGAHTYRQPALYFPTPGGTFAGESLPGKMTWARAYIKHEVLWMDIGHGEVVRLPPATRDAWWEGTTRQWPFMAADLGIGRDTLMAHYLSNHVAVAYGDIFDEMVALSQELGFKVRILRAKA